MPDDEAIAFAAGCAREGLVMHDRSQHTKARRAAVRPHSVTLADMAAQEIPPLLSRSYRTVRRISSPISPALRSHPAKPQICEPATFAGQSASET
jgi:hypothetical protein